MRDYKPTKKDPSRSAASHATKKSNQTPSIQKKTRRSDLVIQNKLQTLADASPHVKANNTGLPQSLKSGIENLSGYSMDDVKVHYNSSKPAQLQAHAYAQGTDIHVASGQEKHLPHEAWHVVQQKQGRVKPTLQMKGGVNINDDKNLEKEADVMGHKATQVNPDLKKKRYPLHSESVQQKIKQPVQRKVGFEFQAYDSVTYRDNNGLTAINGTIVGNGAGFNVEQDGGATANEMEIVTDPVDETNAGRADLQAQMVLVSAMAAGIVHGNAVDNLGAGNVNWRQNIAGYHFDVNNAVHFHPQSTVGVKFNKIAELIDFATSAPSLSGGNPIGQAPPLAANQQEVDAQVFGWSGQLDQQPFKNAWATGLANARQDLAGASDNAISFASILYGFAEVTNQNIIPNDHQYAKYFMPFMLRLGLLPHYGTLTQNDLNALGQIRDTVLSAQVLPLQTQDMVLNPTIQELLNSLGQGVDIDGLAGYASSSQQELGMNNITDIGISDQENVRHGAIIELRKLGNDVQANQLTPFALSVFDLIAAINAPGPGDVVIGNNGGGAGNGNAGGGGNNGCGCGPCFLTTACCDLMGLPDDCDELTTLRSFRDNYLIKQLNGQALVALYYHVAPTIVKRINQDQNRNEILLGIYEIICECVSFIKSGDNRSALHIYSYMTEMLADRFYPEFKESSSFDSFESTRFSMKNMTADT